MPRTAARLAAGTLVLALPFAAAAGCGIEKKRTIKAELASANTNLAHSTAASFTLRVEDRSGNVSKLITRGDGAPKAIAAALLGGSITYVVDPVGDKTLQDLQVQGSSASDLKSALQEVNAAVSVRDDKATVGELRLVAGTLYVRVDLGEVGRLAKAGGVTDFDTQLDDAVTSADPGFAAGLADVRAGKWIKLPLTDYIDKFQKLAQSFSRGLSGEGTAPSTAAQGYDFTELGKRLFASVKPYIKVTDANDTSADRVLDVRVRVRPALKAALTVLQGSKDLPFASLFQGVEPGSIDANVTDGTANGTITLKSGHLTQFAVDIESIRKLSVEPGSDSVADTSVIFDVDDSAAQVTAPTDVSSFDLGAVLDQFLQGFTQNGVTSTLGVGVSG